MLMVVLILAACIDPNMPQRKCCVRNCRSQSKKHRFPKNEPDIFQEWIERIKPPGYRILSVHQIYDKYLVCNDHFADDCLVLGTKRGLKRTAVPSLKIPETEEESNSQQVDLFNQEETVRLIEAYKKHENLFNIFTSSAPVWNLISSELDCEDIQKNPKECETKWKSLVKTYRTHIKDKDGNSKFIFAVEMEAVLKNDTESIKDDMEVSDIEDENEENVNKTEIVHKDDNFWSFLETSALVEAYGKHTKSFTKDGDKLRAWGQISSDLITKNIHRSPESCKRKWESLLKKHKSDEMKYEFQNEIDNVSNEQVEENVEQNLKKHKKNHECFEIKIVEKQKRHEERMDMMKRKLDIEERKLAAFEKYLAQLGTGNE